MLLPNNTDRYATDCHCQLLAVAIHFVSTKKRESATSHFQAYEISKFDFGSVKQAAKFCMYLPVGGQLSVLVIESPSRATERLN